MRQHGIFTPSAWCSPSRRIGGRLAGAEGAGSAIGWASSRRTRCGVVLAVIFFLIGLNLMGAFEVGQLAPSSLLSMQAKHPGLMRFSPVCWR